MSRPGPKKCIEDRLTISLIKGQKKKLLRHAKVRGASLSQVVREAINSYVESGEFSKKGGQL